MLIYTKINTKMSSDEDRPALPTGDIIMEEDYDLCVPPTSGEEYLRRVMLEAKECPDIVVAKIDTKSFLHRQTIKINNDPGVLKAPDGYAPSSQWQAQQAAAFSDVRQKFTRHKAQLKKMKVKRPKDTPKKDDFTGWCKLCFGRMKPNEKFPQTNDNAGQSSNNLESTSQQTDKNDSSLEKIPPLLSIVSFMDQPTVIQVLEYHVNWFEATGFSREQGQWFYALLACLEKPLDPEACAVLRQLARNCAVLRATLESADHTFLPQLNLLICLVANYFDQKDLADDG